MACEFVQGSSKQVSTSTGTTLAYSGTTTVGNLLHVMVGWKRTAGVTGITAGVTGGAGNSYTANTLRTISVGAANTIRMQSFDVVNVLGAAHTVTVTLSGGTADRLFLAIAESTNPATVFHEMEDYGQNPNVTSQNARDAIAAAGGAIAYGFLFTTSDRTHTVPTGYAPIGTDQLEGKAAYQQLSAAGTYSGTWNWTGGSSHAIAVMDVYTAFVAAAPTARVFGTVASRGINFGIR
jgi:hypothetical protein